MTDNPSAALVLLVGPPGSGKSTWTVDRFPAGAVFSLDMFRRMLAGDVADQGATEAAAAILHTVARERMRRGLLTVVDACNTHPNYRLPLIAPARHHAVPVLAVVMATPLEDCLFRNALRRTAPYPGANDTRVPDEVVARLHAEARETPPRVGEVDAVLHIDEAGAPMWWEGCLPPAVLSAPWLADTMAAPFLPADRVAGR